MVSAGDYRFQRHNRLLNAAAFGRVFRRPKRSRDTLFTVLASPNDLDIARLGLAISKKHCRPATGRNRLKRIVRESFRRHQETLAGIDVVVINQPAAAAASNATLFDSLEHHWQKSARAGRRPARHDHSTGDAADNGRRPSDG